MHLPNLRLGVAAVALAIIVTGCSSTSGGSPKAATATTTPTSALKMAVVKRATGHVTELNGVIPPGVATAAKQQETLLRTPDGKGHESIVHRTVRAPGTRAPIHIHGYGGTTCVLEGEMTLLMEGGKPALAKAGTCYYMPPGIPMSGFNTGSVDAVMLDMFVVPVGEPETINLETG